MKKLAQTSSLKDRLRALSDEWRETARIWEDQLQRDEAGISPVGRGRGNILNWINWLRGCARQLDELLAKQQPRKDLPKTGGKVGRA